MKPLAPLLLSAFLGTSTAFAGIPGDLDGDLDVDVHDIAIILAAVNTPASGAADPLDLDGDLFVSSLDAGKAALLCTRPLCIVENDAPIAVDDAATVDEGGTVSVLDGGATSVLDNDSDPNGDALLVTTVPLPSVANGILSLAADGTFSYTHDGGETTTDAFTYEVCDDASIPACATATVAITIGPIDDPPVAVDDAATLAEDAPATIIDVLGNDTDPDAGPISIASVTQPAAGTVMNGGTSLTYQPDPDTCNDGVPTDDFTYTLTPGGTTATVAVTVSCVNDPPALSTPHMAAFVEDAGSVPIASTITVTDPDSAVLQSASVAVTNVQDGSAEQLDTTACGGLAVGGAGTATLAISGAGTPAVYQTCLQSVTYRNTSQAPTETPARSITLVVNDGALPSNSATSTTTVTGSPDPPMAVDDAFTTVGHTELVAGAATPTSLARVRDADGVLTKGIPDSDPVELGSLSIVALQADTIVPFQAVSDLGGNVAMNVDGSFTYVPPLGVRNVVDTFTYTIQNTGGAQDVGTVSVTIADELVRYVHNDPAGEALNPVDGPNAGRSDDPYDTLAQADFTGAGSLPNETVLVFVGDGTTAGYDGGIALTDGQVLRGQPLDTDASEGTEILLIGGLSVEVVEPTGLDHDTKPEITNGGGAGVTITDHDAVEVRGLDITGSTSGVALSATTGAMGTFTRATIAGNDIAGTSAGHGVDVSSTGTANLEVLFENNVVVSGDDDAAGTAFFGASFAGSSFIGTSGTLVVSSFVGNAVGSTTTTVEAGLVFDTVTFDADTTNGTIFSGGTRDAVLAGPLVIGVDAANRTMGPGLVLQDVRGDLDVDSVDAFTQGGTGVQLANGSQVVGDFSLVVDAGSVDTVGGTALDLDPATVGVTLASVVTSGSFAGPAIRLVDLAGAVDLQGGSLAGSAGATFEVIGGTADVTYSGSITNTAGPMISVQDTLGGTVVLDGASLSDSGTGSDTGTGIRIADVTGNVTVAATTTTLAQSDGSGIEILGAVSGTVRIVDTTITDPVGPALRVDGDIGGTDQLTGSVDLDNVDATASTAAPIVSIAGLGMGGSVDFDTASAVTTSGGGGGIVVTSNSGGAATFRGPSTLATGTSTAVDVSSSAGTTVSFLGDLDIDTTSGVGFQALGGSTLVVDGGSSTTTVDTGAGSPNAVRISGVAGASGILFDAVTATGSVQGGGALAAIQLNGLSGPGVFTVATTIVDGAGAGSRAILITSLSTTAVFGIVTIDDTTEALCLNSNTGHVIVSSGTIGATTTTSGKAIDIGNAGAVTSGNVMIAATIANSSGQVVEIDDLTAGNVVFDGAITDSGAGIVLDANTGGTITFRGGLALDTGANTAFTATNGGTVNVCSTTLCSGGGSAVANTIGATTALTGTAVDVATTIGGEGMTFRSIDVDGITTTAVRLADTGGGSFSVTGDGTTSFGGNASGGTIQNVTGADAIILDNTGGLVTLQNVVIEDVVDPNDAADAIQTRRFRDGIHGENVLGGLRLQSVTMRRFSDHAVLGALFSDGTDFTTWDGLEIRDSLFENANRFHVPGRGDDADEGVIRIRGLTGTMIVDNSTVRLGGRGLDIYTPAGAGTLDATIQRNTFEDLYKEFASGATRNVGGRGISFEARGSHDMVVRVGDPAEMSTALGNTFTNNTTASVVVTGQAGGMDPHTGDIDTVISRNDFIVTDHTTAQLPFGNLTFDFPQGGVSLNPAGGTYDAIVSHNLFDEVMHAAGGLGQLTLGLNGGAVQAHVHDNTFRLPWDGSVQIRAEGTSSAAVLFEDNNYVDGMVGSAMDDVGFATQSPFNPVLVNVRAGGKLDLTMRRETFPQHDTVFTPADRKHSIEIEVQADSAANELDLHLVDNEAPEGYHLKEFNGSFELFMGASGSAVPGTILQDNGNRGGGSVDTTNPPTVVLSGGAISAIGTAPTLPTIVIP